MEGNLVQISKINDFIFCPYSIYFHEIYESFDEKVYHDEPQTEGKINHKNIDKGKYSSKKGILQGMSVFSEELGVIGKIDLYDVEKEELIERKTKIKKIYEGYKYQLYAQMFCLREMGYGVKKMTIRSLKDNKKYDVPFPTEEELKWFRITIFRMKKFDPDSYKKNKNPKKCARCIYSQLCP